MDFYNPKSILDALDILAEGKHKILAGGTDLLVKRNFASSIVNICDLIELNFIKEAGSFLEIGASITHEQLERSNIIKKHAPILAAACSVIGSPQIRNKGTLGGNIVTASPAGDTLTALSVLNCQVVLESKYSKRNIRLDNFITGPGKHILNENEILTKIIIEKMNEKESWYYKKVGLRNALAVAVVGVAIKGQAEDGIFKKLEIALGSVGPKVIIPNDLSSMLLEKRLTKKDIWEIVNNVDKYIDPIDDIRASREERILLTKGVLFKGICEMLHI